MSSLELLNGEDLVSLFKEKAAKRGAYLLQNKPKPANIQFDKMMDARDEIMKRGPETLELLCSLCSDPDPFVALAASSSCILIEDYQTLAANQLRILENHENASISLKAGWALKALERK